MGPEAAEPLSEDLPQRVRSSGPLPEARPQLPEVRRVLGHSVDDVLNVLHGELDPHADEQVDDGSHTE